MHIMKESSDPLEMLGIIGIVVLFNMPGEK
jgi:hypothetical protein